MILFLVGQTITLVAVIGMHFALSADIKSQREASKRAIAESFARVEALRKTV